MRIQVINLNVNFELKDKLPFKPIVHSNAAKLHLLYAIFFYNIILYSIMPYNYFIKYIQYNSISWFCFYSLYLTIFSLS